MKIRHYLWQQILPNHILRIQKSHMSSIPTPLKAGSPPGVADLNAINLSGKYTDYLPLHDIDTRVRKYLTIAKAINLSSLTKRRAEILAMPADIRPAIELENIQKEIDLLNSVDPVSEYVKQTDGVLAEFKALKPKDEITVFSRKPRVISEMDQSQKNKSASIILRYLETARKFAPLNYHSSVINTIVCSGCGNDKLSGDECNECGMIQGMDVCAEADVPTVTAKKTNIEGNIKRAVDQLSENKSLSLGDDKIVSIQRTITPYLKDSGLTGRYITFKISQMVDPKVSPAMYDLKMSSEILAKCDKSWLRAIELAKKDGNDGLKYLPSF